MTAGEDTSSDSGGADSGSAGEAGVDTRVDGSPKETPTPDGEKTPVPDGGVSDGSVSDGSVSEGGVSSGSTTDSGALSGAPDDEEMPLTDHIEEMVIRLGYVIVWMAVVSVPAFIFADDIINQLWYNFLPAPEGGIEQCATEDGGPACPRVYHPLALVLARLKTASLVGFVTALPVFVYQTYRFMRPGLYPHERRYYLASVPTSLLLALVGVAFAYFLVLPLIFRYFLFYSQDVADIAFGLSDTFDLILMMMGLFAAIFQIPLFMMLAIMMGVTSRRWLENRRILFWFGFGTVAFIFSPDPTGMAPFLVALTMIALFELTLLLLRWTGR